MGLLHNVSPLSRGRGGGVKEGRGWDGVLPAVGSLVVAAVAHLEVDHTETGALDLSIDHMSDSKA